MLHIEFAGSQRADRPKKEGLRKGATGTPHSAQLPSGGRSFAESVEFARVFSNMRISSGLGGPSIELADEPQKRVAVFREAFFLICEIRSDGLTIMLVVRDFGLGASCGPTFFTVVADEIVLAFGQEVLIHEDFESGMSAGSVWIQPGCG